MWRNYFRTMRAQFYPTAVLPVLLGSAMAYYHGAFDVARFLLTTVGIVFINAGTNLTNEYFDFKSGLDEAIGKNTPFSGGSMTLFRGEADPKTVLGLALACFTVGAAIGLWINALTAGNLVLWIGIAGILSGFFYTAPPFRLGYRSFGEPLILLNLGPLATIGAYYVQVQDLARIAEVGFLSLIPGLMMFNVLLINEFPDAEGDRKAGKKTLVVQLGKRRARYLYLLLTPLVYAVVLLAPVLTGAPLWIYLGLITLPLFLRAVRVLWIHYERVTELLPANASTILMHLVLTTLVAAGFVLGRAIS
ncbi:MAG: 1,4-dihydroxy-2-naphthoate octaprenyltransferase [Planctomycetota bacterium]